MYFEIRLFTSSDIFHLNMAIAPIRVNVEVFSTASMHCTMSSDKGISVIIGDKRLFHSKLIIINPIIIVTIFSCAQQKGDTFILAYMSAICSENCSMYAISEAIAAPIMPHLGINCTLRKIAVKVRTIVKINE